ncbi:Arc family DNA-binding protein [Comamonas sp. Y6]|uniref:Arc family DNA-binding protein n=1 Tax=Comamonas resistens TaxID=3046670 RepID=A0ABY8SVV5_9BURK|nr:Arc family DNA-binding protein [Comamonas resistens]MDL5036855.1 Arc family DNA-binding protein [Comamonas resistens]WHS67165.1 Arc family DNA-binding protein [Comamonas resistens]
MTPYPLRMPDDLRSRLEEAATQGNRSLHAEIVSRLEQSLERSEPTGSAYNAAHEIGHLHMQMERLIDLLLHDKPELKGLVTSGQLSVKRKKELETDPRMIRYTNAQGKKVHAEVSSKSPPKKPADH